MLENKITPLFQLKEHQEIIFLDIEADSKNQSLLQFGAIKLVKNKPFMINWYSNPGIRISPHTLNLIGYDTLKRIRMGYSPKEIMEKIDALMQGTIFVSFGDFDYKLLNDLAQKYLNKTLDVTFINFQNEWRKINENLSNISLSNLASIFEIPFNENNLHDAFFDAKLMYQIFRKWEYYGDDWVSNTLFNYNHGAKKFIEKSDETEKQLMEIQNYEPKGYILFEAKIKRTTLFDEPIKKNLLKFSVITTIGDDIDENWSMDFANFYELDDHENYQHNLIACLRRFLISTKDKSFYIFEHQRNDLLFLKEICLKYLNKDLGNEYFIINGIQHYVERAQKLRTFNNVQNKNLVLTWDAILIARKDLANRKN